MKESAIEYIHKRKDDKGNWVDVEEIIFKIPPEEMAVAYAAHAIRLKCLMEAESNLKDYCHREPMKIGGRTKTVEIRSALDILKLPLLKDMNYFTGSDQAVEELQSLLPVKSEYRAKRLNGLQLLASVGWLADVTRARPPSITEDKSSVDYEAELFPENLEVKEETVSSGYNKIQAEMLKDAQRISGCCLKNCGELKDRIECMTVASFGELVFKTYSRLFGALPDPEAEERARFEDMRKAAEARREEEDD